MNREDCRKARSIERRCLAGGPWPPWTRTEIPKGVIGDGRGWSSQISMVFTNTYYVALVRYLDDGPPGRVHLAIRTASNLEPPWRDLQRIKNELFGEDRFAVQVCPPQDRLIDEADMYHLWIMPAGHEPGFGLHPLDEPGR